MTRIPIAVLAAGRGQRLAPLTDSLPKGLLPLPGGSPLERLMSQITTSSGVGEVILVSGFARERIAELIVIVREKSRGLVCRELFNPSFDTANNIVSALALRGALDGRPFVLVNSDVVCHPAILASALASAETSAVVVDPATPPRAEAMKVRFQGERLQAITKTLDAETADGEYIGIARFSASGSAAFFRHLARLVEAGATGEWYEAALGAMAVEEPIGRISTEGLPWLEIDDFDDLRRAESVVLPAIDASSSAGAAAVQTVPPC